MEEDPPLLLAMPRRPLYGLNGFIAKIDLNVLSAIAEEGWCATAAAIADDVDCKEVRIGVLVRRRSTPAEGLVDAAGRLLLQVQIPPGVEGLPGLKALALKAAIGRCPGVPGLEMAGYINDDACPDLRRVFTLVYRAEVPAGTPAPEGMAWVVRGALDGRVADPASRRAVTAVS